MQINLPNGLENSLIWWPEKGFGFHPQPPMNYEGGYWKNYRKLDRTEMGEALTQARIELVSRYFNAAQVVDIGIGGGAFVEKAGCRGYDVNPEAVKWLHEKDLFCSPYADSVDAVTCWDSLEHIDKPWKLLKHVKEWLFVSLPIFTGPDAIVSSKHYKPGEHIWYFTHGGLIKWAMVQGFWLVEHNNAETHLGREGIVSYAFKRLA